MTPSTSPGDNMTIGELLRSSDEELGCLDVAETNLACAAGLPGAESLEIRHCLETLAQWAEQVSRETDRLRYLFDRNPDAFEHSRARFHAMVMVTVLQRDIGIRYEPTLIDRADFFASADNLFIHGVIQTGAGTCSSLPPTYLAVGRRLGYPLKLVAAKSHLFVRWDDPEGDRFNIECTSRGFNSYPDEHYLSWPLPTTPEEAERFRFLRSMTPREELASFLATRGHCWLDNGHYRQAVHSYASACCLAPDNWLHSASLVAAMNRWRSSLRDVDLLDVREDLISASQRKYPALPLELEEGIKHMETFEDTVVPSW